MRDPIVYVYAWEQNSAALLASIALLLVSLSTFCYIRFRKLKPTTANLAVTHT